ncbi:AzlD domain-containing protein [Rhodospirillum rubrum]|uniref:Branched-chain amino acid transport n=1 Tax=Rhodospirillum rubrum (strain ATCC 11170 / ATH 1.1.1 / DSM 467 / LMG 4362 / NCIMB 8255 / S1) TaxID=269796 RepID=Q2RP52_RHORT|nr:AzlD domain-containing protein [Rhodospirillum rubrum]ABC24093.1 hypothetical protein Rru_A3298 [Rhodospirillum rubrum ATCC 11170]AEO49839.1 hypothetical protein F11_16895 [Rhodospirillum rubrum F11]MBK5955778.1 hypothetical protein [Rhodospirillum rubrum]QXG80035.1 AzlD domain-containing protein [Rhodospirillum rubrum]HAP99704.1 hypothetical protein [Rhodospirillum rubrum]
MADPLFTEWQLWAVAAGGGLGTLLLRLVPVVAQNAIAGARIRLFFDRAGFGILGGIVSTSALKSGQSLFTGTPVAGASWALLCVGVAFLWSLWRGGTVLPTLIGLALFVGAGVVFPG